MKFYQRVFFCCSLPAKTQPKKKMKITEALSSTPPFYASKNWMNDPNGLFYFNEKYHLFFTILSKCLGANALGHVSEDLLHWEELPIALYPDDMGYIFSGCGRRSQQHLVLVKRKTPYMRFLHHNMDKEIAEKTEVETQTLPIH